MWSPEEISGLLERSYLTEIPLGQMEYWASEIDTAETTEGAFADYEYEVPLRRSGGHTRWRGDGTKSSAPETEPAAAEWMDPA